jgi:predicted small integral membrane protein
MTVLRLSRIALVAAVAAFFTLVAFGNVTDYGANWRFVTHVMSMDTTFRDPEVMWRAVTDPTLQRVAYGLVIAWQAATALVLWVGVARLLRAVDGHPVEFAESRAVAIAGLTMGLLLYAMGFLVVAGEWFAMWQSQAWNGQQAAGIFLLLIGLALLHLCGPEPEWRP